jgi:RHS repeat-associated protein
MIAPKIATFVSRHGPKRIRRLIGAAALAGAATLLALAPNGPVRPLFALFGANPAEAICSPDPRASGWLTTDPNYNAAGGAGPSMAGDINSSTVYAYIAAFNGTNDGGSSGEKNCGNPVYRYGGVAWLTNSTTATLDWGATTANGNSSGCYPLWGTNDYVHANSTTTCVLTAGGNPGINYRVLAITLAPANMTYRRNTSLISAGDFEYVFNSCSTFYQDASGTGEVVKTGVAKSSLSATGTQATIGPGANCGSLLTQDDTGYSQSFDLDTIAPSAPTVSNNASTLGNAYAASPTATTIWVNSTTSGTVTLTPSSTDNLSGIKDYTFGTMAGTTTGWSPTAAVTQAGARGYSWTSSVANGQSASVAVTARDNSLNSGAATSVTLLGDDLAPTGSYSVPAAGTTYQTALSVNVAWTETETGSGLATRSLQRQIAPGPNGVCGTFANDPAPGNNSTSASPVGQTLVAGSCYRWVLTLIDNVGLSTVTTSGTVIADPTPPPAPGVVGSGTGVYTSGTTVFFNNGTNGTATLTSTGSDPESGIASSTFGAMANPTSGWTYSPGTVTGNPAPKTLSWTAGAANNKSITVTTTNRLGAVSPATTVTFVADTTAPSGAFSVPASGTNYQTVVSINVTWSESDAGSGPGSRTLQRQIAPFTAGACGSFANDTAAGNNSTAPSPVTQTLTSGSCYRWVLTVTDNLGNTGTPVTSGVVVVDATAPAAPAVTDNAPTGTYRTGNTIYFRPAASGTIIVTSTASDPDTGIAGSTFGSLSAPSGWTYVPAFVAGNPAQTSLTWSSSAGSSALPVTATNGAGGVSAATQLSFVADGVAPAISSFLPGSGTASQTATSVTVSWAESESGSGLASRSLQRQKAASFTAASCASATYVADGAAQNASSSVVESGLSVNTCYRWQLTLTDRVGNVSATATSGMVFVYEVPVSVSSASRTAAVGEAVWFVVGLYDSHGQPLVNSNYSGTVCISASAGAGAVYPDGACASLSIPGGVTGHSFRVLLGNVGTFTLTASGSGFGGSSVDVAVSATTLVATAPVTAYAGVPMTLGVAAHWSSGTPIADYNGLVTFSSSDSGIGYGYGIDGNHQARMICGCDDGHPYTLTFANIGAQTLTVTDEFGNTDTVNVNVVAAPNAIALPSGFAAYAVQWENGHTIDYYIKNLSGLGLRVVQAYTTCSAPGDPQGTPQDVSAGPYSNLTVRIALVHCWVADSGSYNGHHLIIADDAGHMWDVAASRYYRFSDIPGSVNFTEVDAGDPLYGTSLTNITQAYSPVEHAASPDCGTCHFNVIRNGLTMDMSSLSSVRIVGYTYPGNPGSWSPEPARQPGFIGNGTSHQVFDYIPWSCYFGGSRTNSTLTVYYVDRSSGRDGTRALSIGAPGIGAPSDYCANGNGNGAFPMNGAEGSGNNPFALDNWLGAAFDTLRNAAGDPVDVFTGSQTAQITDFTLGGLTPSLTLTRSYRSDFADAMWRGRTGSHAQQLLFGPGWGSQLDANLEFPSATVVDVRLADSYVRYNQISGGWSPSNNTTDSLTTIAGGWKLTHLDGSGFRFDAAGRLSAIFDANGRELVLSWTSGKVTSMTDAAGRTATFTTDGVGRITRVDLPGGRDVAYTYDASGYLHTVRDLGGTVLTYNADVRGRIASVQNATGDVLLRDIFDDAGRVVGQYDALNAPTFFNYDDYAFTSGAGTTRTNESALMRTVIDPRGAASISCYNTKGLQLGSVNPVGGVRTWTFDTNGNPARSVDELGFVTTAVFDGLHEPTKVTDALGHVTNMTWDTNGHPASVTSSGSSSTTTYDPSTHLPLLITTTDGTNSVASATYTYYAGTNLLATATGPGGVTTTYHYDAYGYVDYTIDPEGRKSTFVTDPNTGLLVSTVDALGNAAGGVPGDHTTTYTYDDAGRVLTVTDPLGNMSGGTPSVHRTTYTYDSFGRVKTISRASGALTTYNYDLAGRVTSIVEKLDATNNATTSYEYDDSGNLKAVTDAQSRRTETTYDLAGQPISVKDNANKVSTIVYDLAGQVTSTTDATNVTHGVGYDALGRITSVTDGAGKVTTYAYDPGTGLLSTATDPLTHATNYGYDWLGRLTSVTNANNEASSVTYDARGNVATATNPRNKTTSFTYNNDGQLLTVTEPGDAGNIVTTYTYDAAGRLHTRQNDRGAVDTYDHDALDRPTRLTDAVGKVWQTFYTNDGQIDHTIDGKSQTTAFGYDLAGRLLTVTPASPTAPISYAYDKTDRVLTMTDGAGATTYGYDAVGRLGSVGRGGRTVAYAYDDAGRPKTITYPASLGSVVYGYDTAGRLSTITDWASRVTTYHYDDASRVSSLDRPGSLSTAYTYDAVDRPLAAVTTRSGNTLLSQAWTYDPDGNIASLTDDTGAASFTYDNLDRLLTASYPGSQSYAYTYDTVGNMTQAVTPAGTASYTYDLADRITSSGPTGYQTVSSVRPPSTNDAGWTSSANAYALDATYATATPAKNQTTIVNYGTFGFGATLPADAAITSVTVSVTWKVSTASSNPTLGSQLYVNGVARGTELTNTTSPTTDTTQTYSVTGLTRADLLDGALTIRVRASRGNSNTAVTASLDAVTVTAFYPAPGGPSAAPTYDDDGNMTSDGTYGNRTYVYDTLGRLTSVTVTAPVSSTTTYTLDGSGNRRSQTTGGVTTTFDLDLLAGNATILYDGTAKYLPGSPGSGYEAGGTWRTALTDLIGSPIEYVDTAGVVSGLTHYDPYGAPRTGSAAAVGIGYAGEYRDATGLVNLRARSYDPVLGRFIGRDTYAGVASAPQTGNRYAYAVANPLRFSDPSGRFVQTVIDNPASVLEFALTFTPIGAALVFGYMLVTGTDPATGEHVDTTFAGIALIAVTAVPVLKFLGKGLGALTRGLGEVGGATVGRIGELGGSIGSKIGSFAGRTIGRLGEAGGAIGERIGAAGDRIGEAWNSFKQAAGRVGGALGDAWRARPLNEFGHIRLGRAAEAGSGEADTFLYQKLSAEGQHLKFGITANPTTRYTTAELNGGQLNILASGPRRDMLALERALHEWLPIGPEEGQSFYIQKQISNGLRPPPYE